MPGTYPIWLQTIAEAQDAVSAQFRNKVSQLSSAPVLPPQCEIIARQEYAPQFQCKVWGHYVAASYIPTVRFAKAHVLYFCCRTTLNCGSFSETWANISALQ